MKIIRWLLSHTILILLIVAVIYGYMFWGNLLGEDTPAGKAITYLSDEFEEVAEFVDAVKAKNSKSDQAQSNQQVSSETSPVVTENSENVEQIETHVKAAEIVADSSVSNMSAEVAKEKAVENVAAVVSANTTSSGIEQKPVSISYSHNDMRITQNSNGITNKAQGETVEKPVAQRSHIEDKQEHVASVAAASVPNSSAEKASSSNTTNSAVDNGESAENFVSEDVEDKLENLDNHGKVIDASKNETLKESWIIARKSFYQRNYKLSEQSYLKVIDASEDNYDAYGELGNVYFNQGKNQQAASAYYEAAAILVRQGQIRRARSLVGLLHHLDKVKAVELQKLIGSSVVKKVS